MLGAVLYDARQLFDGHNAKADVLLRSVAEALPEAVATCLDAAGAELSPLRQAALLKVRRVATRSQDAVHRLCQGNAPEGREKPPQLRYVGVLMGATCCRAIHQ